MKRTNTRLSQIATRAILGIAAVGMTAGNVAADWHSFWHGVKIGYHRNNAWPEPFNEADARDVVTPFEIMKQNGWKMHNTIGHQLFREGDGVLMASGSNRLHWIATQAPMSRRQVLVLRGKSELETQARLASVRNSLASMNIQGPMPSVTLTDVEPAKASGIWANKISREWVSSMPKPQLPATSITGEESVATPSGD